MPSNTCCFWTASAPTRTPRKVCLHSSLAQMVMAGLGMAVFLSAVAEKGDDEEEEDSSGHR